MFYNVLELASMSITMLWSGLGFVLFVLKFSRPDLDKSTITMKIMRTVFHELRPLYLPAMFCGTT